MRILVVIHTNAVIPVWPNECNLLRSMLEPVMGASFRNLNQVVRLAGCDLLTISPQLLKGLENAEGTVNRELDPVKAQDSKEQRLRLEEKTFRRTQNEDAMATEKLAEGIHKFNSDTHRLQLFALARVAETIG